MTGDGLDADGALGEVQEWPLREQVDAFKVRDEVDRMVTAALQERDDEQAVEEARRREQGGGLLERSGGEVLDCAEAEAELAMIRALLHAEQTNDLGQISSAQAFILSSETLGRDLPLGYRGDPAAHRDDAGGTPTPLTPAKASNLRERLRNVRVASARKVSPPVEHGLTEQEMAQILGSDKEEEFVTRLKLRLRETRGAGFLDGNEEIAADLDFWARACLRARRFRVNRAIDLLCNYAACRTDLDRVLQSPADEARVRWLLEIGIITFLEEARCKAGRGIVLIRMQMHDPKLFSAQDVLAAVHRIVVFAIRQHPVLQAVGFTIICDMTGSTLKNFDTGIPKLLGRTIDSKLPIRYGQLIVVNPPTFFSAIFRVVSLFLSAKMRARLVRLAYKPDKHSVINPLEKFIRVDNLPPELGGSREIAPDRVALAVLPAPKAPTQEQLNEAYAMQDSFNPSPTSVPVDADPRFVDARCAAADAEDADPQALSTWQSPNSPSASTSREHSAFV